MSISKKHLVDIIHARYHEIFVLVKEELAKIHRDGMLPSGIVFTGAGAKIPGIIDLARETLNLPVQIGFPHNFDSVVDKIDDPSYATVIGLMLWGARYEVPSSGGFLNIKDLGLGKIANGVKNWLKELIP